jgi:hypothetical protein
MEINAIQSKILEIRGHKVMLDFDLADIYEVETRILNQAVKRNVERFPNDFMFRLTAKEWATMSSQFVMTYPQRRPKAALPYAFTEHGVTMLASVLRSDKAVKMNIAVVRAFIALRQFSVNYDKLAREIIELKEITGSHNKQLNQIYEVLKSLMVEKSKQKKWEEREQIGFKPNK